MEELLKALIGLNNEKIHTIVIGKAIEVDNEKMTCTIKVLQYLPFRKKLVEVPEIFEVPLVQPLWNKRYAIKAPFSKEDKFVIGFTEVDSYKALGLQDATEQESTRKFSIDDAIVLNYLPQNNFDSENEFPEDLILLDRVGRNHLRIGEEGINILGDTKFDGKLEIIGDVKITGKVDITGDTKITGALTVTDVINAANLITPTANFNAHFHMAPTGPTTPPK